MTDHRLFAMGALRGTVAAGLLAIFLLSTGAIADVLILNDGTRLEGTVRRTPQGYSVTSGDGTVTDVAADQVASFHLKGDSAGGAASDARFQSLRRSVANLSDLALIIGKYENFVAQNPEAAALEQALAELEQWRDFQVRGLVKHGADWVTPAERDRRLRDAFLEVSDARMQIKAGEIDKAQRTLDRLLENDPNDISALYLVAVLDLRQGQVAKARANFEKVRAQEKFHAPTLVNLAAINMVQERQPRALTFLSDAMLATPGNREILDNVAEALNLLAPKVAASRQAEQVHQVFLSQDAALRQQMAARGLYRWGSTWVDRAQLEELQALEKEINKKIEELTTQYTQLERDIADIDRKYDDNVQYMQRLEANRTYITEDGKMYLMPLPPAYFDAERDNQLLQQQRDEKVRGMATLEQQAAQERSRYPTPPFRGKLTTVGEDGVPVRLPQDAGVPADPASTPATEPAGDSGQSQD